MMMKKNNPRFVFFGTGEIGRSVCEALEDSGLAPVFVVTAPDAPAGRGLKLEASAVAKWASDRSIRTLKAAAAKDAVTDLRAESWDVFIVADYGLFLGKDILAIPKKGCLNMHPSLLPRLRGPSPIRSAILNDEKSTGVTIMLLDEELDHGPIIAQKAALMPEWPPHGRTLDELLAHEGGALLAQVLPLWITADIEARPQNHDVATYCEKFKKEDGLLNLADDGYKNLLKIRAFEGNPGTYTFFERGGKKIRVQILDAHLEGSRLVIDTVKPEGKREMSYEEFARSGARPL